MTGPWSGRESILAVVGMLLCLSVGLCVGKKQGQVEQKLADNKVQIRTQDSVSSRDSLAADVERKKAFKLDSDHDIVRTKVRVVHDTVFVDESELVVVDETLSKLIVTADSTIAALKRSLALQDTLIAGLRQGIALRDTRIKLLESKGNPRISKGVQAGVGYCATQSGNTPCVYIGYGFQVRLP